VLLWLTSYVSRRTRQRAYNGQLSPVMPVSYGIAIWYSTRVGSWSFAVRAVHRCAALVESHGFRLHHYTNDCLATPVCDVSSAIARFTVCLADVGERMSASRMQLNPAKSQVMEAQSFKLIVSTSGRCPLCRQQSASLTLRATTALTAELTMADQVAAICRSAYFPLR